MREIGVEVMGMFRSSGLREIEMNKRVVMGGASIGIELKVAESSLPGNRRTTFKERTSLILFREGSLTKC